MCVHHHRGRHKRGTGSGRKLKKSIVFTATDSITLSDGSVAEFDGKLNFGNKDSTISINARAKIESWESKRRKNKVEYAYSVLPDGTPIGAEMKGGGGSVRSPISYYDTDGAVFTHIHPRGDGMLGGTFSYQDLKNFATYKGSTSRAAAKEGTYSISKAKNFDNSGFLKMAKQADKDFIDYQKRVSAELSRKYRNKEITLDGYKKATAKEFNSALIQLHETYRANQNKYGYIYSLEQI